MAALVAWGQSACGQSRRALSASQLSTWVPSRVT
jgi:hypothetical protein